MSFRGSAMTLIVMGLLGTPGQAQVWSPAYFLSSGFTSAYGKPAMAFDSQGRLHMIFMGEKTAGQPNLHYRMLNGNQWSAPFDLPGPNFKEPGADIAIDSNDHIHVAGIYRMNGDGPYTVWYWNYNGTVWTGPAQISSGTQEATSFAIDVDRFNDVHIVYLQAGGTGGKGDIYYRKRQSGIWQSIRNVTSTSSPNPYGSDSPDIKVDKDGNTLHVVWHDEFSGKPRVYYTQNTNLGDPNAWWPQNQWQQLSANNYGKAPSIFLDNNNLPFVFWYDDWDTGNRTWVLRYWTGSEWSAKISLGTEVPYHLAFDQDNLMHYVYGQSVSGTLRLFYKTYNLSSFSTPLQINNDPLTYKTDFANIAIGAWGQPHIIWEERQGTTSLSARVFYTTRGSLGAPPPVTGFAVSASDSSCRLTWRNPDAPNLSGVTVRVRNDRYPTSPWDGNPVISQPATVLANELYTHSGLPNEVPHYYAIFTRSHTGEFSAGQFAVGIPHRVTTMEAKQMPNGAVVELRQMVVTAVFPGDGCFYIADPNRASGLRVDANPAGLSAGDLVSVGGLMGTRFLSGSAAERQIINATFQKTGQTVAITPLAMSGWSVGGAAFGPLVPGVKDGTGLNNIGNLVTIWGRVSVKLSSNIWVDDGSGVVAAANRAGVMVRCPSTSIPVNVGDIVQVTGIVQGSIPVGWTENQRLVVLRDWTDLVKLD